MYHHTNHSHFCFKKKDKEDRGGGDDEPDLVLAWAIIIMFGRYRDFTRLFSRGLLLQGQSNKKFLRKFFCSNSNHIHGTIPEGGNGIKVGDYAQVNLHMLY